MEQMKRHEYDVVDCQVYLASIRIMYVLTEAYKLVRHEIPLQEDVLDFLEHEGTVEEIQQQKRYVEMLSNTLEVFDNMLDIWSDRVALHDVLNYLRDTEFEKEDTL